MSATEAVIVQPERLPAPQDIGGTSWCQVLTAYLDSAIDSELVRRAYTQHLKMALDHLGREYLYEITGGELAAYRAEILQDGRGVATHAQALSALRAFLRWSGTFGAHVLSMEMVSEALRTPKADVRRPYQVLSEAEVAKTIKAAWTPRDRALLATMLGGGLRVAELVGLNVVDVVEDGDGDTVLHVRKGKGRKDRPLEANYGRCFLPKERKERMTEKPA